MERMGDIVESIANEKNLNIEDVKQKVRLAFINCAKELFGEDYNYDVEFSSNQKNIKVYHKILVVKNDDERVDNNHFMALSEAKKLNKEISVGDEIKYYIDFSDFGRTASAILSREFGYHIQQLVEETNYKHYQEKMDEIIFGTVIRVDEWETTYLEIDDAKVYMPRKNRIKGENFEVGDIVRAVIRKIYLDKQGIRIEISRTSPKFLEALLKVQVPEIEDGSVIIQKCARIPGERAKVALSATRPNIDPVGATVGVKGVRINAVSKELNNENIDVIEYSPKPEVLIARAMAPAIVNSVTIKDMIATVHINSEQKSKAIGKNGINIRLASTLCGHRIELVEENSDKKDTKTGLENLKELFGDI